MDNKTIGKLIYEGRKNKNISQEDLAKYIHVTRQTVSNWENDKNIPDMSLIVKLCEYLDIDLNTLINSNGNDFIKASDLIQIENKKVKKKMLIPIFVITLFLIISIFVVILIINRNYFEVYDCMLIGDGFKLNNCTLVKSKIKNYFVLGNLKTEIDYKDLEISLYYRKDGKKRLIIEKGYEDDFILFEDYGYGEYFDDSLDDIYLDLTYIRNGKTEVATYKMQFDLVFKDSKLFYLKQNAISDYTSDNTNNDSSFPLLSNITEEALLKNKYKYDSKNKIYKKGNKESTYYYHPFTNELNYQSEIDGKVTNIIYYLDYNLIELNVYFKNKKDGKAHLVYNLNENKLEGNSSEYNKDSFKIIIDEANKIAM